MQHVTACALLLAATGLCLGAEEIVESVPGTDLQYSGTPSVQNVTFTTGAPITGVAVTADWSAISGDLGGGSYPWAFDLAASVTAPSGESAVWTAPFTGDTTIADFPIADGSGPILSGASAPGTYQIGWFDDFGGAGSLAELTNVTYHATTTVPDVTFNYTATPDPETSWARPFFIAGVSGLGPTSYHVLEFEVDTAGVYDFTSVLSTGGNHFTVFYAGGFDDTLPLENLLDYGLGNGFSPFDVPQGESRFSVALFPGQTYSWVTTTWSSTSPIADAANTIVGPGAVLELPIGCPEDFDNDGDVDLSDFGVFGAAFGSAVGDANYDARADFDGDGDVDLSDFGVFGAAFGRTDCLD